MPFDHDHEASHRTRHLVSITGESKTKMTRRRHRKNEGFLDVASSIVRHESRCGNRDVVQHTPLNVLNKGGDAVDAVEQMRRFMQAAAPISGMDIKALIAKGRAGVLCSITR